jgi:ubiquitin carboxyl-terminal hydrolase 34
LGSLRAAVAGSSGGGVCHLRLISQGQELVPEMDERTLADLGFKDTQLVFANLGSGARGSLTLGGDHRANSGDLPPFPGRAKIPMLLLLEDQHFDQLFQLMSRLSTISNCTEEGSGGQTVLDTKAQILSRRVWEILLLLPTSPKIKQGLEQIDSSSSDFVALLDPESPQRLLYSFYIIDWLGRPARLRRHSGLLGETPQQQAASPSSADGGHQQPQGPAGWVSRFIQAGGLKHLFNVFLSGVLGRGGDTRSWCEWRQDCLGALLRLLVQFGVDQSDVDTLADQLAESSSAAASTSSSRKRIKWMYSRKAAAATSDRLLVPLLAPVIMELLMDTHRVMAKLGEVFLDVASQPKEPASQYKTGLFGRSQVVHFAMSLLVSWVYSGGTEVREALFTQSSINVWLKQLLLEDHDPAVRREVCTGIYRLCLGSVSHGAKNGSRCIAPVLAIMLDFLDAAQLIKPMRREAQNSVSVTALDEPGKEPFGPACRDYFWLVCKLVESLPSDDSDETSGFVETETLGQRLMQGIISRPYYERRLGGNSATPDDALIGMLNLMAAVLKQRPQIKQDSRAEDFVHRLFNFLFALPSPQDKLFPKCKSQQSRTACYDLLVEMVKGCLANYSILHGLLVGQQRSTGRETKWEYWPREEGRSECGYVGLINLGATCYMATCVQQLFMIPATRTCVLQNDGFAAAAATAADVGSSHLFGKHHATLHELRRMFAYLLESERKAYNPLSFCKTYTMDQQPLNTGEQKDMAEFFIDLLSKMEEMTPELKTVVKSTFCGTLSNNVVSLDCGHVSTTTEEFYTVRCQVSEMRSLYQSLEEVCVKDMLEGDNMYTCSQCGTKVRAEKRACFKSLPEILAFNTMRYSFNMVTMLKEKVNTHFSFPFHLDMAPYMEHNLIPKNNPTKQGDPLPATQTSDTSRTTDPVASTSRDEDHFEYELIGVTVHTGNADGGHYYAFIKDRSSTMKERWYSFNDAEVKAFDPGQIAAECFGGEMSSRTYDQVTDKFLDLSIEKTNSAYMLFYERIVRSSTPGPSSESNAAASASPAMVPGGIHHELDTMASPMKSSSLLSVANLSPDLEEWIWQDNRNFIQDNSIFDHTYFNFMWQMVGFLPTTLAAVNKEERGGGSEDITMLSAKLATTFFLETFIHAKEKLNIVQWVEILTKQLDSSVAACKWFLSTMAADSHWPVTIFLRCNIATIRQMFHRLVIHVIQKLRHTDAKLYLLPWSASSEDRDVFPDAAVRATIGQASPVTQFVRMLLRLLESGTAKAHLKHLTGKFQPNYYLK